MEVLVQALQTSASITGSMEVHCSGAAQESQASVRSLVRSLGRIKEERERKEISLATATFTAELLSMDGLTDRLRAGPEGWPSIAGRADQLVLPASNIAGPGLGAAPRRAAP